MRHRAAVVTIAAALVLDVLLGMAFALAEHLPLWHGMFCALANAVTDGGDVGPSTAAGYAITAVEYMTVVPLFAATYSFFTSGLTAGHVEKHAEAIKQHVTAELGRQPGEERR